MSTRSLIGLEKDNNIVEYIYCHFDGYPDYVGSILKNYYNSVDKIESLLKRGDLSSLGKKIKESNFYRRDRNDDYETTKSLTIDKNEFLSDKNIAWSEYRYLYTKDNELKCYQVYENKFVDIPSDIPS